MLNHLTAYLLQHKQVGIPHVGTLRLLQRPPALNVADKVIEPPSCAVEISRTETISEHQWTFLESSTGRNKEAVANDLRSFGDSLWYKMNNGGFDWEGLGTITNEGQPLVFAVAALQPMPAEKVVRPDAAHKILVGDREIQSVQSVAENKETTSAQKRRPLSVMIGWTLLLLSVVAVVLVLYSGKFTVNAAGSRLSPKSWVKLADDFSER